MPVHGFEEKRNFTVTPIISATGISLFLLTQVSHLQNHIFLGELCGRVQVIWEGSTSRSCPKDHLQQQYKHDLSHTFTKSHWATPATVEKLIDDVYKAYISPKLAEFGLNPAITHWLILMDVHSSHIDRLLLARLKIKYPTLVVLLVPPSTTPVNSPLDVHFNAPWKTSMKKFCSDWLSTFVMEAFAAGQAAENVQIPLNRKGDMVPQFLDWLSSTVNWIRPQQALMLRAWKLSAIIPGVNDDYGLLIAWAFDHANYGALLAEAKALQVAGKLFDYQTMNKKEVPLLPSQCLVDDGLRYLKI